MKYKITFAAAIASLFLVCACDEKYEPVNYEDIFYQYEPIDTTFFAGDKDSCTYYDYEPDIVLSIGYLNSGYFEYSQPFDIDKDGINDFALVINGFKDSTKSTANYWKTIIIKSLVEYKLVDGQYHCYVDTINGSAGCWGVDSNFSPDALIYGDTFVDCRYDYDYDQNGYQMLEIGYDYFQNSHDTCCGDWNIWDEDRYVGFRKYDSEGTVGWIRLEMQAETDLIVLKDCGIQKFSEKRKF